ncbi:MAG TPA: hypothetical protein VNZ04_09520 [Trinickia sp.]|jgi:hypothetical protein|nr:hypothetical protein [Trinickia sp.]
MVTPWNEAREIPRAALSAEIESGRRHLAQSIRKRIERLGGIDLDLPAREAIREHVELSA